MPADPQSSALVAALKKLLKARGATYRDLARALDLSEASVKRLFSARTFTLRRVEEICTFLEVDFFDLARLARGTAATTGELTLVQEKSLAADPRLLGVFYLVFNGWQPDDIYKHYALTRAELVQLVLKLDRLGLAELHAGDRVRLRAPKNLRLRRDGPIERAYGESVLSSFIEGNFERAGGLFRFELRELSKASAVVLQRRVERLAAEFNELAELDSYLPSGQRETTGLALGIRPWPAPWSMGLKPRAGQKR